MLKIIIYASVFLLVVYLLKRLKSGNTRAKSFNEQNQIRKIVATDYEDNAPIPLDSVCSTLASNNEGKTAEVKSAIAEGKSVFYI